MHNRKGQSLLPPSLCVTYRIIRFASIALFLILLTFLFYTSSIILLEQRGNSNILFTFKYKVRKKDQRLYKTAEAFSTSLYTRSSTHLSSSYSYTSSLSLLVLQRYTYYPNVYLQKDPHHIYKTTQLSNFHKKTFTLKRKCVKTKASLIQDNLYQNNKSMMHADRCQ